VIARPHLRLAGELLDPASWAGEVSGTITTGPSAKADGIRRTLLGRVLEAASRPPRAWAAAA
jgi:hypothetical protein